MFLQLTKAGTDELLVVNTDQICEISETILTKSKYTHIVFNNHSSDVSESLESIYKYIDGLGE